MTRVTWSVGALAVAFVLVAVSAVDRARQPDIEPVAAVAGDTHSFATHSSLLHGRVVTTDGETYEGKLRWGGVEEALWGNYFNGFKAENRWAPYVPNEVLPSEQGSIELVGFELASWEFPADLRRPFMVRFGDITRIDASPRTVTVMLKNGTEVELDRFSADDLADGVRVWDESRGVVDIGEWTIKSIELTEADGSGEAPSLLYGTVHTAQGSFTGLVRWDREQAFGSDELRGQATEGEMGIRFEDIRAIERDSDTGARVALQDGREIELTGTRHVTHENRGIYIDDERYGRVLVSWDAFQRVEFSQGATSPAYDDFPPGQPLYGVVTTRSGRTLEGRLVYDLDESETTATLDAPAEGVDYTIPFGHVQAVLLPDGPDADVTVLLHNGEELRLKASGDLADTNAGLLVFEGGAEPTAYVSWADVARIDFDQSAEGR